MVMSYKLAVGSVASLPILSGHIGAWVQAPRKNIVRGKVVGSNAHAQFAIQCVPCDAR